MNGPWARVRGIFLLAAMAILGAGSALDAADLVDEARFGKANGPSAAQHQFTAREQNVGVYERNVAVQGQGCLEWQMATPQPGPYMLEVTVQAGRERRGCVSYQQGKQWIGLPEMKSTEGSAHTPFVFDVDVPPGQPRTAFRLTSTARGLLYLHGARLLRPRQPSAEEIELSQRIRHSAEAAAVRTDDGLTISLDAQGKIRALTLGKRDCTNYQALHRSGLTVLDVSDGDEKVCEQAVTIEKGKAGRIVQRVDMAQAKLKAMLTFEPRGDYVHVRGQIESLVRADRGVVIQYALPLDAIGWHWEPTLEKHDTVQRGRLYENSQVFMSTAGLEDGVRLEAERTVRTTKLAYTFCSSLYGDAGGLSFGQPRDEFRIFNVACDAELGVYRIEYTMGLSPDTKRPNQATFSFILYPTQSRWGYRAALEKYYRIFPQFFEKRVQREGGCSPFANPLILKDCDEFLPMFCWSPQASQAPLDMGLYAFRYYAPPHIPYEVKGYSLKAGKVPPLEAQLETLDRIHRADPLYTPKALVEAIPFNQKGQYMVSGWDAVASLEPELAFGQFLLAMLKTRIGNESGVAYDGLAGGLNYRREHFRYADHPLLYDPVVKSCAVYNLFSCLEFVQQMRREFDALGGKLAIVNIIPRLVLYGDAFLDITTEECGLTPAFVELGRRRETMYHKPVTIIAKDLFQSRTPHDMERSMQRCLYYGVFPGCFGGMPGIRHSFSSYWIHPEWYNRDRHLWRKYMPLVQEIAQAGWEPVPYAQGRGGQVGVQRFGSFRKGAVYFTVRNDENRTIDATLAIDGSQLKLTGELLVIDELTGQPLPFENKAGTLSVPLTLDTAQIRLVGVSRPAAYRSRCIERAVGWLQSRKSCRLQEQPYGQKLTAWNGKRMWGVGDYFVDREIRHEGQQSVRMQGRAGEILQPRQLVQPRPYALTISGYARCEGIEGEEAQSPYGVQVTVHYRNLHAMHNVVHELKFPPSSTWQYRQTKIAVDKPVENVQVRAFLKSNTDRAKVWFDDLCLQTEADGFNANLLDDAGFEETFLTAEQTARLDGLMEAIQKGLVELRGSFAAAGTVGPEQRALAETVRRRAADVRRWVAENRLEPMAGRELRDLADIERLLAAGASHVLRSSAAP